MIRFLLVFKQYNKLAIPQVVTEAPKKSVWKADCIRLMDIFQL